MRPVRPFRALSTLLGLALVGAVASGCRMGARAERMAAPAEGAGGDAPVASTDPIPSTAPLDPSERRVIVDDHQVGLLSPADVEELRRSWLLFVNRDPAWKDARASWLAKGPAAADVLAANLLRYFWSASKYRGREEVLRVAESARAVGAPAVGYFLNVLVLDSWPLKQPVLIPQKDGTTKELTVWVNDDVTRQHLALVLARIGPPAVPALSAPAVLRAPAPSARRYAIYALGSIASDDAVAAVAGVLSSTDWQDRASAAKALGFALPRNAKARAPLERAAKDDDPFVRKKAEEALAGKSKAEF
jgi:hypothetical protein